MLTFVRLGTDNFSELPLLLRSDHVPNAPSPCFVGRLVLRGCRGLGRDPWHNARIMPKSDQVLLRCGREITGDAYQIALPATVERIEGQWLRVADQGGYRVPPVSGWVRKDEVLKLNQANSHYTELLQTADSPWIHWLVGICLEEQKESATAQEEFLKALGAVPGDNDAVWMAVEANPNLLDAAVRLERLKVAETKSSGEAVAAANRIQSLAEAAQSNGIRRPQAIFEQAEALQKAYRLKLSEERKTIHGIDEQIARANLEIDGGSPEDRDLFKLADGIYQLTATADPDYARTGPHRWKGSMGRAELYLTRVASLNDEAWSLIGRDAAPPPAAAADAASTNRLGATMMPIDFKKLDAFCKRCRLPEQNPATASRACAMGVCLAVEIQLLRTALKCFDETVRLSPDLVEAYRDRGLALSRAWRGARPPWQPSKRPIRTCGRSLRASIPQGRWRRRSWIARWWTGENASTTRWRRWLRPRRRRPSSPRRNANCRRRGPARKELRHRGG